MTSTNIQVGFGSDIKSSSKVLKPPGGGSSDIFGGDHGTPRGGNKSHHFSSNIFAAPEPVSNNGLQATPRGRAKAADSHNRLFGEPDRPATPAKNHARSNIPFGGDETDRKSSVSSTPSKASVVSNGNHTNGKMENGGGSQQQHISNGNGTKESEDARQLGGETNDGLENLDTRSVRSHLSSESLLPENSSPDNNITNNDNNNVDNNDNNNVNNNDLDNKSVKSLIIGNDNNNSHEDNNNNEGGAAAGDAAVAAVASHASIKVPDLNISSIKNNNIFGEGTVRTSSRNAQESRNPVTGIGIIEPHYNTRRGLGVRRDGGNPVTGEGYSRPHHANGLDSTPNNTHAGSVNGANQVINKNRVPPGGFSSGLW